MTSIESIYFWATTFFLALSFALNLFFLFFKNEKLTKFSNISFSLSLVLITFLGITRWVNSSHPPFVTLFESMITSIWFILLIVTIVIYSSKKQNLIVLPVSFITFLMMGWASSLPAEASSLSAALSNVWLFIHASFATSGAACALIAASYSIIFLLGKDKLDSYSKINQKIPAYDKLPKSVLNFQILGFILWGVMIVSGSIWAHNAWGRYWAWDPIETWSLISWLLFGLVVHTRITFKISNKTYCWLNIITAVTVVFSLWGVGYIYDTIHNYG